MSQEKQIKKSRQSFNVYIPPPARKAENVSQQVVKQEELKSKKVVKVKSGGKEIVNTKTLSNNICVSNSCNSSPLKESVQQNKTDLIKSARSNELSIPLNLSDISDTSCVNCQKFRDKRCHMHQSYGSQLNIVKQTEDSNFVCDFSEALRVSENTKDIYVKESPAKSDLHKSTCNTQKTDEKSSILTNGEWNDTLKPEEQNHLFRNLWEKLCEHENSESIGPKSHTHKANDICGSREINDNCILEIYDFPAEFKTSDLREIFSSFIARGMKIRWVDDTHALGIYPSEIIAYEVLNTDLPHLKTRVLNEGIPESRDKAKLVLPPPPPPRPKTCSASARRMVSGALGIRAVFTQAEIEEERQLLRVAREQKLLAAKQRGLKGS